QVVRSQVLQGGLFIPWGPQKQYGLNLKVTTTRAAMWLLMVVCQIIPVQYFTMLTTPLCLPTASVKPNRFYLVWWANTVNLVILSLIRSIYQKTSTTVTCWWYRPPGLMGMP